VAQLVKPLSSKMWSFEFKLGYYPSKKKKSVYFYYHFKWKCLTEFSWNLDGVLETPFLCYMKIVLCGTENWKTAGKSEVISQSSWGQWEAMVSIFSQDNWEETNGGLEYESLLKVTRADTPNCWHWFVIRLPLTWAVLIECCRAGSNRDMLI
jgi:hypothetical protein